MVVLKKYRLKCETEDSLQYVWAESPPTTCPNNSGHTVNSGSITILETVDDDITNVLIQEETVPTGGHFQACCPKLTCPSGEAYADVDVTWEYPVSLLDAEFVVVSNMKDDMIEVMAAPDTIIGAITSGVAVSGNVLQVQQSVMDNLTIGRKVSITDGTNLDEMGYVTSMDANAMTITLSLESTNTYSAATPTYVRMSVMLVRDYHLGHSSRFTLGQGKVGGSPIPAGTVVRIRYHNLNGLAEDKEFYAELEYLY